MSLEQALAANTAALIAMTAALSAAGVVSAASTGGAAAETPPGKPAGKAGGKKEPAAPKGASREDMVAALTEVKEKFGAAEARAIITEVGAAKMAEIADGKVDAAFKLAKAKLEATDDESGSGDDDGL